MDGPSEKQYLITASELERLIDRRVRIALDENKVLSALGDVLIDAKQVTRAKDLSPKTISQNKRVTKYNQTGGRKLLMQIKDVDVIQNRKRGDK